MAALSMEWLALALEPQQMDSSLLAGPETHAPGSESPLRFHLPLARSYACCEDVCRYGSLVGCRLVS